MFEKICDVILAVIGVITIGLAIFVFVYSGYNIYGYFSAPYIISADEDYYFIKEYTEENGYYYATTIYGDECKIPVEIAVVKKNK